MIKRQLSSQKNNLSFDYNPMGQRTAKHVYTSNGDLLSSTYYTLDAQGNVMTTYEMNIDTINTSLTYFQAEKYIYGSSRLGMLKDSVNVLGSAYTNTDTSNFVHTLGNKRYELSNHLGNVLTVISDKPIPHNNGGTVDYFMADIKSAYDYSPFGVMLTGRTFEGTQTVCHDSTLQATQNALEEGFGTWGSWTAMADGLVTYVADEMQVSNPSTSKKNIGASKTFTTGEGLHSVSFVVIGNMCSNIVIWPPSSTPIPIQVFVRDNANNIVASGNYTTAGSYNLSFTPVSSGANYKIEFYMTNASAFCFFRVDDVLVSYEDESVVTVCKEVDGFYRYGYQGSEKDDEAKGRGNSYTTFFRQLDPRLGRWLTIDPKASSMPWQSPYVSMDNNPIWFNDLLGDSIKTDKDGWGVIKIGLDATLGKLNPFSHNSKTGALEFNDKIDLSNLKPEQAEIVNNYKSLVIDKEFNVQVDIISNDTKFIDNDGNETTLALEDARGVTILRNESFAHVYISNSPIMSDGSKEIQKEDEQGITGIHEIGGHSYFF